MVVNSEVVNFIGHDFYSLIAVSDSSSPSVLSGSSAGPFHHSEIFFQNIATNAPAINIVPPAYQYQLSPRCFKNPPFSSLGSPVLTVSSFFLLAKVFLPMAIS